jgi:hypothetical protein
MKNAKTYLPVLSVDGTKVERSEAAAVAAGHPDPEVVARAKRRIFTGEYKQRVLAEADAAKEESGGIGALLRREGLFSSHLSTWRHERAVGIADGHGVLTFADVFGRRLKSFCAQASDSKRYHLNPE